MVRMLGATDEFVSVITYLKYDLLVQDARQALVPAAVAADAALICASPLHAGLLGSRRDHWRQQGRFEDRYERLERVEAVLDRHGLSPAEAGLRYLLSDPRVGTILSGVDSVAELERSAAASDAGPLDAELIRRIEEA